MKKGALSKSKSQQECHTSQNPGPKFTYLLRMMQCEASIDARNKSVLNNAFKFKLSDLQCRIKLELKRSNTTEVHRNIVELVSEYRKLQKFFVFCLSLERKKSEVTEQVQKFREYIPETRALAQNLKLYIKENIIFDILYDNYVQTYNSNIFTTDLISYLYALHQANILPAADNQRKVINEWHNSDYELLHSPSINFKQLSDIHKKYEQIEDSLTNSYVMFACDSELHYPSKESDHYMDRAHEGKFTQLLSTITKLKMGERENKIRPVKLGQQAKSSFDRLDLSQGCIRQECLEMNKKLLNEILFGIQPEQNKSDGEFWFIKKKIVRVETLYLLNKILECSNLISHIYNELDLENNEAQTFVFKSLNKLIESEFLIENYEVREDCEKSIKGHGISYEELVVDGNHLVIEKGTGHQIVYPSALNSFYKFIGCIAQTKIDSPEMLIQILGMKSRQIENLQLSISSLYTIIKNRQINCYQISQEYISALLIQSSCWGETRCYIDPQHLLQQLSNQQQKAGLLAQILYQLDGHYRVDHTLRTLLSICSHAIYCHQSRNNLGLFRTILQQIIETRNGLKLDHYYSLERIHQTFELIPKSPTDDHEMCFEQIVDQVCQASSSVLQIPKLLHLFDLQLRLKRAIFKLQLYWSYNRELMHHKKSETFKQFIQTHCSPIFTIMAQCHVIRDVLQRIEQLQKSIDNLSREVGRFYFIEKLLLIAREGSKDLPKRDLKQHLNRLEYNRLEQLSCMASTFNPAETFQNADPKMLVDELLRNIKDDNMAQRQSRRIQQSAKLANNIYFLESLASQDIGHLQEGLAKISRGEPVTATLEELKLKENISNQYQTCLLGQDIQSLSDFFDNLALIGIQEALEELEVQGSSPKDCQKLKELLQQWPLHQIFTSTDQLIKIQSWKDSLSLTTKYHKIYQLMHLLQDFEQAMRQGNCQEKEGLDHFACQRNNQELMVPKCQIFKNLHILSDVSPLNRLRLQRKISEVEFSIIKQEPLCRKPHKYAALLRNRMYSIFCKLLNKFVERTGISQEVGLHFEDSRNTQQYYEELKQKMIRLVNFESKVTAVGSLGPKQQVEMFGQVVGYEVPILQQKRDVDNLTSQRKALKRTQKALSFQDQSAEYSLPIKELIAKSHIETIKRTLQSRKIISKLQLVDRKMRDEITWETSKLEHTVIEKINHFISMSSVDQQQSYINFKHTVNLETVKGIENVIEEQTEMYIKKKNNDYHGQAFLTEAKTSSSNKERLLDVNVGAILDNMKKIKVFWAWKKATKKTDLTQKQWIKFNQNIRKILRDKKSLTPLIELEETRNRYFNQDVECEIIRQGNLKINNSIQSLKIENLGKKVTQYRNQLLYK